MEWVPIILIYIALYVLLMDIGYYLTLPHYNRKIQLRTGRGLESQWRTRCDLGERLMRLASQVWIITTIVIAISVLVLPLEVIHEKPKHLAVIQIKDQQMTIAVVNGKIHELDYKKCSKLLADDPRITLTYKANLLKWKLTDASLKLIECVENPDEIINNGRNGGRKAPGKNN